jgi:hypothetical protein
MSRNFLKPASIKLTKLHLSILFDSYLIERVDCDCSTSQYIISKICIELAHVCCDTHAKIIHALCAENANNLKNGAGGIYTAVSSKSFTDEVISQQNIPYYGSINFCNNENKKIKILFYDQTHSRSQQIFFQAMQQFRSLRLCFFYCRFVVQQPRNQNLPPLL